MARVIIWPKTVVFKDPWLREIPVFFPIALKDISFSQIPHLIGAGHRALTHDKLGLETVPFSVHRPITEQTFIILPF